MAKNLVFRRFQKSDGESLSQLLRQVLHVNKDSAYWHWKYYQNPAGEHMMIVGIDEDRVVAIFGCIPIKMKAGQKIILAAQGVDITIHPDYRRRGTFFKLEKTSKELFIKNNTDANYAFSIKETYRIFTKLAHFTGICPIYNMTKVINPTPYLKQKVRLKSLGNLLGFAGKHVVSRLNKKNLLIPEGYDMREVQQFDHRYDELWLKESKHYEIAVVRDSAFLNWRYIDNPEPYKIFSVEQSEAVHGFIVLKCSQEDVRRGRILDIFVESSQEEIIDLLLKKAINYFLEEKMDVITCWMMEHWPHFQYLKGRGFVKRMTAHDLMVRSFMHALPNEYFMDISKWYITMGDSDYF